MIAFLKLVIVGLVIWAVSVNAQPADDTLVITSANAYRLTQFAHIPLDTSVHDVLWTADSAGLIVIAGQQIRLYNTTEPNTWAVLIETDSALCCLAISHDGQYLAFSSGMSVAGEPFLSDVHVYIIDIHSGVLIANLPQERTVSELAFSGDDTHLLIVDGERFDFSVWEIEAAVPIAQHETNSIGYPWMTDAVFSPDASILALGAGDAVNTITLWDTGTGEQIATFNGFPQDISFSDDGRLLAGASRYGGFTAFWELPNTESLLGVEYSSHYQLTGDFSFNGDLYVNITAPVTYPRTMRLIVWKTAIGQPVFSQAIVDDAGTFPTVFVRFSPDSRWLLTIDDTFDIRVWGIR